MSATGTYLETLFSLEGKTAILVGAGGGIGRALAFGMARAGAAMALCDIRGDRVTALAEALRAEGLRAEGYRLDIASTDGMDECVRAIAETFSGIDILVNCAGINKREGYLDVLESTYDQIMAVNLKGPYFFTQKVVPHIIQRGGGKIVNVSSHNAQGMLGGVSVYGATKSALSALTRSMAIEWAKYNIQANAIAPGHVLTELTQATWDHPERAAYLRERIAMGRPGTPDEMVGMVIMLASKASAYMTGQTYHVDGGCLAGGKPWPYDTNWK